MDGPTPDPGFTVDHYFALVEEGVLEPDDRVELLEGGGVSKTTTTPTPRSAILVVQVARRDGIGT